ncbi:MAG: hypothetical protein GX029_01830, partial [Pseudomonadaceae bacterium]|nr:hypothetical protein [Pseudomonadaceae bacterium]
MKQLNRNLSKSFSLSGLATALVAAGLLASTGSAFAAENLGGNTLTPMGAERA